MTDTSEWQGRTGESWAAEWRRTDRSFTPLTDHLLATIRGLSFRHVLDIGCGAGELALAIARQRTDALITGVDVSEQLIAVARQRAEHLPNIAFHTGDAAQWQAQATARPDLLISRHGVMFFADPVAAFGHLAQQAAPGAHLLFSCFRDRSLNPFFTDIAALLPEPPALSPPNAPGPFAFADGNRVRDMLARGGWSDIHARQLDLPMIAGAGEDPIEDAVSYFQRIGPAAQAAAALDPEAREAFLARLRQCVAEHCHEGIVSFRAAMWIVTACKA